LDTLPRERRGPNYSDAYDSRDEQGAGSRRVNPTVEKVVANTANMVVTQPIPSNMGMTWESQHPTVSTSTTGTVSTINVSTVSTIEAYYISTTSTVSMVEAYCIVGLKPTVLLILKSIHVHFDFFQM
jgi:hypothetical protein